MATRYWVGGSGNWSDTAHWSTSSGGAGGASVPTSSDDVVFNSASHTTDYSVNVALGAQVCRDFTATAPASGNLTLYGGNQLDIYGSVSWYTGMVCTLTGDIYFQGTGSYTLNFAGTSLASHLVFNGSGGTWTLSSALVTTGIFHLNYGTFNANGYAVTVRAVVSNNSNTRTLNRGSAEWTITGNNTTILNFTTSTNLTHSGAGAFNCTYSGGTGSRTIVIPTATTGNNTVNVKISAGTDTVNQSTTNILNYDFTGFSGTFSGSGTLLIQGNLTLSTGCTVTYTGNIAISGSGAGSVDTKGKTMGSQITISRTDPVTFTSGYVTSTANTIILGNGSTVDATGQTLTAGGINFSGSSAKTLTLTNGTLNLTGTGTVLASTVPTNIITGGTINVTDTSATQKVLQTPGMSFNELVVSGDNVLIQSTCTITTLRNNTAGRTTGLVLYSGITLTITNFTTNGASGSLASLSASTPASPATMTKLSGYVNVDYMEITDSTVTGVALWYAGSHSTDGGGNTGWIFTPIPLKFTLNDVDMSLYVLWNRIKWDPAITSRVDTMKFSLFYFSGRTLPALGDEVSFSHGDTVLFSGTIVQLERSIDGQQREIVTATCKDRTTELDRFLVQERYENTPLINIIIDILNRYGNKGKRQEIATFEGNEIWSAGAIDTDHYRVGEQGRKLTSTNAVASSMTRDIIVDLDGSVYDDGDYIEIDVYVDTVANLDTCTITLGNSALSSYYSAEVSGQITADGWNHVRVLRSAFSSTGSPAWASIAKIKIEVVSVASTTVEATFDNWNEVKDTAFTWTGAVSATQEVKYIAFNYEPVSKALKRLAELFAWDWYVTPDRAIVFVQRFAEIAPFSLDDTSGNYVYNSLVLKQSSDQIRNAIYVRGSDYLADSTTEDLTHQSDGTNTVYKLGFGYKNYSLEVNSVPYSVGVQNLQSYTDNEGAGMKSTGGTVQILGSTSANQKVTQQVYCTGNGTRATIALRIRKVGAPSGNFQVQIFEDNGSNEPSATSLSAVATLASGSITTSFVEYEFALTPTVAGDLALVAGDKYHIVLSRSSAVDASNYYELDTYTYGTYKDGVTKVYNGSAWSQATSNLYFIEYSNFEALYAFNEKTLVFASPPNPAHTIEWTGEPYLPVIVRVADSASVAEIGNYEMLIQDLSIKSKEGARQRALAELTAYANSLSDVTFTTYEDGLNVGQTITIQSDIRGIDLELMITGMKARCRSPFELEYEINCVTSKKMGIIYWMQELLLRDNQDIVIDDNEILDRTESLAETLSSSVSYSYTLYVGKVWSNDAGTTPNALQWDGGSDHIWV